MCVLNVFIHIHIVYVLLPYGVIKDVRLRIMVEFSWKKTYANHVLTKLTRSNFSRVVFYFWFSIIELTVYC